MSSRRRSTIRIWLCAAAVLAVGAPFVSARAQAVGNPPTPAAAVKPTVQQKADTDTKQAKAGAQGHGTAGSRSANQSRSEAKKNQSQTAGAGKTAAGGARESAASAPLKKKLEDKQAELDEKSQELVDIQGDLDEKTGQLDDANTQLKAANDKLDQLNRHGLAGHLSWLAPAASALLSLFAILWVVYERRQMQTLLETKTPSKELQERLENAEKDLRERQAKEQAAGSMYPAPSSAATAGLYKAKAGSGVHSPQGGLSGSGKSTRFSAQSDELLAKNAGLQSAALSQPGAKDIPSNDPAPDPPPAYRPAVPLKPTGDIVADYNTARSMADNGPDWFKTAYHDWVGLSCTNTSDLLINPKAVPLFQLQDQGSYLGVNHRGEMRLVPALEWDLAAFAPHMKGIFEIPSATGGLLLQSEALIEQSGELWKLNAKGVIRLG